MNGYLTPGEMAALDKVRERAILEEHGEAEYAPLATFCGECGSALEREPHDEACSVGAFDAMAERLGRGWERSDG